MSAVVIPFPAKTSPSRTVIEATIERLIDLLDAEDAPAEDCELEPDEASDDDEVESWQEWHTRASVI